ncbi:LytR C-terminal domain-containing protein [Rothia nasimurium]|uniref:LytR C-terminal domain-containing protein n=1 Tax=Rothia nasimurium TaxID=85336 RepID=UPI003BA29E37
MNDYPRDEFDDIDEKTARRGAYRAAGAAKGSRAGILTIILCGLLTLLIGGTMYVLSPRTAGPASSTDSASASASASGEATVTASASASESAAPDPSAVTVEVYNSSAASGSAAVAAAVLEDAGYTVSTVANWAGAYAAESMVYYATGSSGEADDIADRLKLPYINQDYQATKGLVYVVLGPDFDPANFPEFAEDAGLVAAATPSATAEPTAEATAQATAAASATASATPAPSQAGTPTLYVVDPVTATYVEATEAQAALTGQALYTLDPATGTYIPYTPDATATAEATDEAVQRYNYNPATDVYYLDPTGPYILDPVTGTYRLG